MANVVGGTYVGGNVVDQYNAQALQQASQNIQQGIQSALDRKNAIDQLKQQAADKAKAEALKHEQELAKLDFDQAMAIVDESYQKLGSALFNDTLMTSDGRVVQNVLKDGFTEALKNAQAMYKKMNPNGLFDFDSYLRNMPLSAEQAAQAERNARFMADRFATQGGGGQQTTTQGQGVSLPAGQQVQAAGGVSSSPVVQTAPDAVSGANPPLPSWKDPQASPTSPQAAGSIFDKFAGSTQPTSQASAPTGASSSVTEATTVAGKYAKQSTEQLKSWLETAKKILADPARSEAEKATWRKNFQEVVTEVANREASMKSVEAKRSARLQVKAKGTGSDPDLPIEDLAAYEAKTGDTHVPMLVGVKEGIVNANAMQNGGAEVVNQLNQQYPAQTPGQSSGSPDSATQFGINDIANEPGKKDFKPSKPAEASYAKALEAVQAGDSKKASAAARQMASEVLASVKRRTASPEYQQYVNNMVSGIAKMYSDASNEELALWGAKDVLAARQRDDELAIAKEKNAIDREQLATQKAYYASLARQQNLAADETEAKIALIKAETDRENARTAALLASGADLPDAKMAIDFIKVMTGAGLDLNKALRQEKGNGTYTDMVNAIGIAASGKPTWRIQTLKDPDSWLKEMFASMTGIRTSDWSSPTESTAAKDEGKVLNTSQTGNADQLAIMTNIAQRNGIGGY